MFPKPLISLIVSVYNQRDFARACLLAALRQVIEIPFEILVCDDGSSEPLLEDIIEISKSTTTEIRYIWQAKDGFRLSRSRNNAIHCARGTVLVFIDGDTIVTSQFLADHWSAHKISGRLVCGQRHTITVQDLAHVRDADIVIGRLRTVPSQQQYWASSDKPWMACLGGNFSFPNSMNVSFDERFCGWGSEDRDLAYRLFRTGLTPILLPESNALHLRLPGTGWQNMKHSSILELLRNKILLLEKYPNGEMAGSLDIVRHCHFDAGSGEWRMGVRQADSEPDAILDAFREWEQHSGNRTDV
jgi:glycosyltransferase involved in cell wall biosynthesis